MLLPLTSRRFHLLLYLLLSSLFLLCYSSWEYTGFEARLAREGLERAVEDGLWTMGGDRGEGGVGETIPILMPVCARSPHRVGYLREVLRGLEEMDGAGEALLVLSLDCLPASPELTELIESIKTPSRVLVLEHKPPWFGIPGKVHTNECATSANIKFLLGFAFERLQAKTAIVLESDLVPARDFYTYHLSTSHLFSQHPSLLSIHSFHSPSLPSSPSRSLFSGPFCSWGWATSSATWPRLKANWSWVNWDIDIRAWTGSGAGVGLGGEGMTSLKPERSRVRMVGLKGVNVDEEEDGQRAKEWEGNYVWDGEREVGPESGRGKDGEGGWEVDWRWKFA